MTASSTPVELPDNLPASHAVILRQAEIIERHETRIDRLSRDLTTLKRELYGSSRERFVSDSHLSSNSASTDDGTTPEIQVVGAEAIPATPAPRRRTSQGRRQRQLDPSIPRENIMHRLNEQDVPAELWNHPRGRRFFRFVREEVELQRASIRVYEHYEEVLVVDDDKTDTSRLLTAPAPEPLIDRCYLGPSFLAYLVTSRFADHIPYYREEEILARSGFSIHRATQCRWTRALAKLVSPLVELLRQRTMLSRVLGIDETPCALICPELGRTRSAYLYAKYGDADHPYVCFDFASRKTEKNVRRIVGDYHGYLQSDAYICYELVSASLPNAITPVACWAHGRRKFEPLVQDGPHPQATWILEQIQRLYDIEDRARNWTNSERHALRQAESRPIVRAIETWLAERDQHEFPKSPLRNGLNYFRNRWESFQQFLEDGAIPIDNNRTEAVIKGPVMGKKNWLFFGNEQAGETAATFYALTMTCKRHCIDVQAYLLDVFRRIRAATPADLESLLPDRWIQAHPESRVIQRVQESHAAASRKRQRRAERRLAFSSA